tara:strand:- start:13469 stop:14614 length:1146 start_codon:yes stop_codon:yes gene_type:complete
MSAQDIINTFRYRDILGNLDMANKANNMANVRFDSAPINPYSSGAFTNRSARNIYNSFTNVQNPMDAFNEYKPYSGVNLINQGIQGLQYGNIAKQVSPFIKTAASNLAKKSFPGAESFNLGPAATVYGLTQNQNPYDFTRTEQLGTIASTAMAAGQLAKLAGIGSGGSALGAALGVHPAVLLGGVLLGSIFGRKKKKKAKRLRKQAFADIKEQTDEIYDTRARQVAEGREDMLAEQQKRMYEEKVGRYDNQYGGNIRGEEGMKMNSDIVAEFTGNELIVNDQDALEQDLAQGNNARVANRIRKAMKGGRITPGKETHKKNPIPVGKDGTMYTKGGPLSFKVGKGAGVYDHATDQFKMDMTDNEITDVVKKNMKKWRKNNMA